MGVDELKLLKQPDASLFTVKTIFIEYFVQRNQRKIIIDMLKLSSFNIHEFLNSEQVFFHQERKVCTFWFLCKMTSWGFGLISLKKEGNGLMEEQLFTNNALWTV